VEVLEPPKPLPFETVEAHVRVGVATKKTDAEMPIGCDRFSYSYRDVDGAIFFNGVSKQYGVSFKPGDVVGVYVNIMPLKPPNLLEKKHKDAGEATQVVSNGSYIEYYVNGRSQGIAFNDLYEGEYFAGAALYMHGRVKFNFGPKFRYAPNNHTQYKDYKEVINQKPYKLK
jgi:Set1/Ash2 histone methyltransferase complex subunit ASH2